jgi:hypothetical protein
MQEWLTLDLFLHIERVIGGITQLMLTDYFHCKVLSGHSMLHKVDFPKGAHSNDFFNFQIGQLALQILMLILAFTLPFS